jgi:3-dehydroquinate synthase
VASRACSGHPFRRLTLRSATGTAQRAIPTKNGAKMPRSRPGVDFFLEYSRQRFKLGAMPHIQRTITASWEMQVFFTEDLFAPDNLTLVQALDGNATHKALVVLEDSLAQALPELEKRINDYFSAHAACLKLVRPPVFVPGGETAKNSITLITDLLGQFHRHHLDRHAYVIAIGGGALLDVVGLAAATCHRGVRLVRVPTTVLSQAESGVGLKNSINAFGQKNFVGTFAPPFAVFNDFSLLTTLGPRDKRNGYVEAVKIACVCDANFFEELERDADGLAQFAPDAMKRLICRCAELHLEHTATAGDPFERGSSRPLDFGHWAAHKLEQLSRFAMRHGEAVAVGIALDVIYSREKGLLDANSAERILKLLERLGFKLFANELLYADNANQPEVLLGLEQFREHLGGELSVTLLNGIGSRIEAHEMDRQTITAAIEELRARAGK